MTRIASKGTAHLFLFGSMLVLGAGCARNRFEHLSDARPAAEAIFAKYQTSLKAGDADAWAALWTDDGVQMPPDAPPVSGKAQIREKLRGLLAQFRFEMQIHVEEAHTSGDLAFARGMYSATLVPKAGGAQIPIDGKFLTILARQPDGSWRIWRDIFNSNQPPLSR